MREGMTEEIRRDTFKKENKDPLATGNHEEMKRDAAIGGQKQLFHVLVVDDEFLILTWFARHWPIWA